MDERIEKWLYDIRFAIEELHEEMITESDSSALHRNLRREYRVH